MRLTTAHLPYHVVNAFTDSTFGGNPAAVMLLDKWLPDSQLQALAAQHNLSETAFLVQQSRESYALRWFTPIVEVPLCGHATLAAAHVLVNELDAGNGPFHFETRYRGTITAEMANNRLAIDLPAMVVESHQVEEACAHALGAKVMSAVRPIDDPWQVLYELENEEAVRNLVPDIKAMAEAVAHCVIVTASAKKADFVSRMFAPHYEGPEDPVTGSAHCLLTPFWSDRLAKQHLLAYQSSARGGTLWCERKDDRIILSGHAMTFARGQVVAAL